MTLIKICGITREDDAELAVTLGADFLGFIFVRESARYVTPERARAISASTSRQARPLTRPLATLSPQAGRGGNGALFEEVAIAGAGEESTQSGGERIATLLGKVGREKSGAPFNEATIVDAGSTQSLGARIAPLAPLAGRGAGGEGPLRVGVFRNASIEEIQRVAAIAQLDLIQLHGNESEEDVRAIALPVIRAFNVRDALPDTSTSAAYVMFDTGGGTGRAFDWTLLDAYARTKPFFLAGGITPDNVEEALRARPDAIDLASGVERAPGIKDHDKMRRLFERVNR